MKHPAAAFAVYVAGIVLAISAAAKVPAEGHRWPDTLPSFAAAIFACCAGLIAWRLARRSAKADATGDGQTISALLQYLRDCRDAAKRIDREWDQLDAAALRQRIDDLLVYFITPLVEQRATLIEHYGMRRGAEILLEVSSVERNLNRAWSATADACPAEAAVAFRTALAAMDEFGPWLDAAE